MEQLQTKTITVNGIRLSYTDSGVNAQPVVFIHGFPFNKSSWLPQIGGLGKTYRSLAIDLRGYGDSEAGTDNFSIDLFASDLLQFVEALKLDSPVLCGLSMGGYIAMNAVNRSPEKFKALVLADTQCIADSEEGKEKRFKTIEKIESEGLQTFADGFVQNVFNKNSLEAKKQAVDDVRKMITGTKKETVTKTLKALAERKETCTGIKKLKLPALIICGKDDNVTPLSQSELLNNSIVGSKLQIIENAGHLSNLEQPEEFNKVLTDFLGTL